MSRSECKKCGALVRGDAPCPECFRERRVGIFAWQEVGFATLDRKPNPPADAAALLLWGINRAEGHAYDGEQAQALREALRVLCKHADVLVEGGDDR
jgi:hypothetical protein